MEKPRLSFWQIWNMSFGFLGIQFGFALQNGNASAILQNYGADIGQLSWFWLVAPFTGMIIQPIIGHYSDRTWNKLGRRKPYFLTGTILCCMALVLLPNSGAFLAGKSNTRRSCSSREYPTLMVLQSKLPATWPSLPTAFNMRGSQGLLRK